MPDSNAHGYVRLRERTALPDLQFFESSDQDQLRDVMRELRIPIGEFDPDEGSWEPPDAWIPYEHRRLLYYYRKGLTRQKRIELDEAARHGRDCDSDSTGTNLWDHFIIYRETTSGECIKYRCPRGITIEAIWPLAKVVGKVDTRELLGP